MKYRDTIYSEFTSAGHDNPLWKAKGWNSMEEMLAGFLNDPAQSKADKGYAAEILQWALDRSQRMDAMVANFLNTIDLSALWEWPQSFVLKDVPDKSGVVHRECVSVGSPHITPIASTQKAATLEVEPADDEI